MYCTVHSCRSWPPLDLPCPAAFRLTFRHHTSTAATRTQPTHPLPCLFASRSVPAHRAASIRHLTSRQYRRISAQQAFRVADGGSDVEATWRTPSFLLQPDVSPAQDDPPEKRHTLHRAASGGGGSRGGGRAWAFPVSGVRLVPKAKGVRAIANLSTRAWADRDRVQWVKGVPLPVRIVFLLVCGCLLATPLFVDETTHSGVLYSSFKSLVLSPTI